jgi:hypothetical protein
VSSELVLSLFHPIDYTAPMPDDRDALTAATAEDLADAFFSETGN